MRFKNNFFEKYPYINNLRSLVSDDLIIKEIGSRADEFESYLELAKRNIPSVNLNKIFPAELENGSIILENFLGHWGNVSIEELCKISLIVKFIKPQSILEIGTYNGMTTLQMSLNAGKLAKVYTLDLPKNLAPSLKLSEIDEKVSKHFKNNFNTDTGSYFNKREDVNIIQLWGDSATFDYEKLNTKFDLIFIDAAHDYANKKNDSENAFKYINKGGVILWHNYNDVTNLETTKYLAEISSKYQLFHLRNTFLAVYHNL